MKSLYPLLAQVRHPARWLALALLLPLASQAQVQTPTTITPVSITALATASTQDFSTLSSITGTSNVLPGGWGFTEVAATGTGADNLYTIGISTSAVPGGAYSLGATSAADRAFGTFYGTPVPASDGVFAAVGGAYTNNTGVAVTSVRLQYTGEMWRSGSSTRTTLDRLVFAYSTTATSLASGTYTAVPGLDFITPVTGSPTTRDGNLAANRTALDVTIPVSLAAGATMYLRWTDTDVASGTDDALGVDDVSVTFTANIPPTVTTATPSASGTTATLGGTVTAAGSASVTDRGVVYSTTNPNPTVGGGSVTQLAIGSGTGIFSGTAAVALFYTTYYVAAYATSTAGTSYGAVQTLTTGPGTIPLTAVGTAYTQNFNTLPFNASSSVTFAKNTLPQGWDFYETGVGADATYASQAGTTGTGNTYSLGTAAATDRALGSVNNIIMPAFGAAFVNNTGTTVSALAISYTGEQWRLGNNSRTNIDRLDFQYSTSATGLSDATGFADFNALDFNSPQVGTAAGTNIAVTLDGNLAANRTALTATLGGLSIAPGATFYLRWVDFDVTGGADDVSGIDDVSITAVVPPTVATAAPSGVSGGTANVGGNVTSAGTGGGGVTDRGVVYSSSNTTPTVGGIGVTQTNVGSGLGTFSTGISGLAPNTLYYVVAYATTSAGTGYGVVQTFTSGASIISIGAVNTAYTENFNTLLATTTIITGTTTNGTKATLPAGWDFVETDLAVSPTPITADNTYSAATPSTGNTYSLGGNSTNASVNPTTDRAFGGVQNATLLPTIGAVYVNNTGQTINGLTISYTGEQWRINSLVRTSTDYLNFEYSTTATGLTSGSYQPVTALDFAGPNVGGSSNFVDGNLPANRTALTATFPVTIANGATFYIRWSDFNAPGGADDALGVDDFSLTALLTTPAPIDLTINTTGRNVSGTYNNVTINSGGEAVLTGTLTVNGALSVLNGGALTTSCQVVNGGGSFALAAGATLSICDATGLTAAGPVQMTGTRSFSPDASFTYNGTVAQVTGATLPATVRGITVNNAAGLTLSQAVSVSQLARLTLGNLTTGGNSFTLLSVAGSTLGTPTVGYTALLDNTGGTVVGTGTMQRAVDILTPDNIGYHHYSAPVSNTTVDDLQTPGFDFVLNPSYNTATLAGQVRPFPTVFGYDERRLTPANGLSGPAASSLATDLGAFDKGFFSPTTGDAMPVGHAFTASVPNALTVDFTGTFNNGNVTIGGLTRGADAQSGWQFLGNPYPSPLDWSTVNPATQLTNMDAAMYQYHATSRYAGNYTTYLTNGVSNGGTGTQPLIPAGAGFFGRVTTPSSSNGALALTNANRVTSFATVQPAFGRAAARTLLTLQVRGSGRTDALTVYTDAAATAGLDAQYDATKLPNPSGLNLAALAGTSALAINGLPAMAATTVVPLTLGVPAAGTYTLAVTNLTTAAGIRAYLRDAMTGTETPLTATTQVPVTLTNVATATTRFSLVFRPSGALANATQSLNHAVALYPNPAHGSFTLLLPPVAGAAQATATLFNALGQRVNTRTLALTAGGATADYATSGLAAGVYALRVQAGNQTATIRVVVE